MDTIKRNIFQLELTLRGIPEYLDIASMEAVEAYQRGELPTDPMHAILAPLRSAFSQLQRAHERIVYIAQDLGVELHEGPETHLKMLGSGSMEERVAAYVEEEGNE